MGFFSRYRETAKVRGTDTYKDMMKSTDRLAVGTPTLMAGKNPEEQEGIMARANTLTEKLHDAIDHEAPLVIGITLLTALQGIDRAIQHGVDHPEYPR